MEPVKLRRGLKADLACWVASSCKSVSDEISDFTIGLSFQLSSDASDQSLLCRAELLARKLEIEAAKIRTSLARTHAANSETE